MAKFSRPFPFGRGRHLRLVSLLSFVSAGATLLLGCAPESGSSDEALATRALFEGRIAAVTAGDNPFSATSTGFEPSARPTHSFELQLPRRGDSAVRLARGDFEVEVREVGASGEGVIEGASVTYARPGGTSFWGVAGPGYEEWLLLDAASVKSSAPVASWQITGATLVEQDGVIELVDTDGMSQVVIAAPEAYAASGRKVEARLAAHDGIMDLFVEADGEPLFVDPVFNPSMSFAKGPAYVSGAGSKNTDILSADFNLDGKKDLLYIAGSYTYVAFGNGNGTFQASNRYSAHTTPQAIAVGDFDGNGKKDFAVLNFDSGDISVRIGVSGGKFRSVVQYPVGASPHGLVVGDFNSDGKQDLATVSGATDTLQILNGNGDGTFQTPVTYAVGANDGPLLARDFDGDGKLDVALADTGTAKTVTVLRGNGNGTFQPAVTSTVSFRMYTFAAAEMNGDGIVDLVVTPSDGQQVMAILTGNGNGTFQEIPSSVGTAGYHLVLGDYNADGKTDVAGTGYTQTGLSVFPGNGNGTLGAGALYSPTNLSPQGIGLQGVVQDDFNGDGKLDLVSTSFSFGYHFFAGNGDGTFQTATNFPGGLGLFDVAAADFNGDGYADVALSNENSQRFSVRLGGSGGTLGAPANFTTDGVCSKAIVAGLLDGDTYPDVVVANPCSPSVTVSMGNGDGTFQARTIYDINNGLGGEPESLAIGDLNNDGKNDIVVHSYVNKSTQLMINNGNGTFQVLNPPYRTTSGAKGIALGDVNGDGNLDVVTADYTASVVDVFLGNGNATLQAKVSYSMTGLLKPHDVALADVNGDGKLDIAVAFYGSNAVGVLLNSGAGTFTAGQSYATGTYPRQVAAIDLNRDGLVDLAVTNSSSNTVSLLPGHGDGTFSAATNITIGSGTRGLAIGDFNGDLKTDLAVSAYNTNDVTLLLNTSP